MNATSPHHSEHGLNCAVTEQGHAPDMDIRSPKRRAQDLTRGG